MFSYLIINGASNVNTAAGVSIPSESQNKSKFAKKQRNSREE